jgi:hypothetical protein
MAGVVQSTRSAVWQHLLPSHGHHPEPPIPAERVTVVAFRIRLLIEELINVEVKVLRILVAILID